MFGGKKDGSIGMAGMTAASLGISPFIAAHAKKTFINRRIASFDYFKRSDMVKSLKLDSLGKPVADAATKIETAWTAGSPQKDAFIKSIKKSGNLRGWRVGIILTVAGILTALGIKAYIENKNNKTK